MSGSPSQRVGRNAPCTCGSGKKWKHCCGKAGADGAGAESRSSDGGAASPRSGGRGAKRPASRGTARRGGAAGSRPKRAAAAGPPVDPAIHESTRLAQEGRLHEAEEFLGREIAARPDVVALLVELARIQLLANRGAAAVATLRRAIAMSPDHVDAVRMLAAALRDTLDPDGTLDAAKTVVHMTDDAQAWSQLSGAHLWRDELEEAIAAARTALERDPEDPLASLALAEALNEAKQPADALEQADRALRDPAAIPSSARALALTERGTALERLERFDEAWTAFDHANRVDGSDPAYRAVDPRRAERWLEGYRTYLLGQPRRGDTATLEAATPTPSFLLGFHRSGTTMTEQVFGAHPDVITSNERPILLRLQRSLGRHGAEPGDFARFMAEADTSTLVDLRRRFFAIAEEELGEPIGDRRLLHKQPMNSMSLLVLDRLFPSAAVVFAVRDPRDICLSCFKQRFKPNMVNLHMLDLVRCARLYAAIFGFWTDIRDELELSVLPMRYEDTVADLEGCARTLLDHAGLPWDDAVLRFHEAARRRVISTPSAKAVTEPIHRRAVGGWRRYARHFEPVHGLLGPAVAHWGYDAP